MEITKPECAKCGIKNKICQSPEGQGPIFCPTLNPCAALYTTSSYYARMLRKGF